MQTTVKLELHVTVEGDLVREPIDVAPQYGNQATTFFEGKVVHDFELGGVTFPNGAHGTTELVAAIEAAALEQAEV